MPVRGRGKFRAEPLEEHASGAIRRYVVLRKPHAERAIATLRDVGRAVQTLMRMHGWGAYVAWAMTHAELPVLAEMCPRNSRLLGLNYNSGQKICLRLRESSDESSFLPVESVLGTHNVHGPHNNHFYALLRTLTDEFLEARRLGYWPGACFLGTGVRLGGASVPPAQLEERRTLAAASALRRQQLQAAPTRLGGAPPTKSLRELAAEAAMRRWEDAKTCASASQETTRAVLSETDALDVVVVYDSDDDQPLDPCAPTPMDARAPKRARREPSVQRGSRDAPIDLTL